MDCPVVCIFVIGHSHYFESSAAAVLHTPGITPTCYWFMPISCCLVKNSRQKRGSFPRDGYFWKIKTDNHDQKKRSDKRNGPVGGRSAFRRCRCCGETTCQKKSHIFILPQYQYHLRTGD